MGDISKPPKTHLYAFKTRQELSVALCNAVDLPFPQVPENVPGTGSENQETHILGSSVIHMTFPQFLEIMELQVYIAK